jgi:hypothetical protein
MSILVNVSLSIASDDLLVGYGAGAKVYLQSAATENGSYSAVANTVIVSGTENYEFWDANGTDSTWYRTRVGNTGGTSFSDFSGSFQVRAAPVLTVAQLRDFVPSNLGDASLQAILDDALQTVDDALGPTGDVTEWLTASGPLLSLSTPCSAVTSIVTDPNWSTWYSAGGITLDPTDYEVSGTGRVLRRLRTGVNPSWWWGGVTITYQRPSDTTLRVRATVELVKLTLAWSGYLGESTQSESRSFGDLQAQRQAILAGFVEQDPVFIA